MNDKLLSVKEVENLLKSVMISFRNSIAEIEQQCEVPIEVYINPKSNHDTFYKLYRQTYPFQLLVRKTKKDLEMPEVLGYAANQWYLNKCSEQENNDI